MSWLELLVDKWWNLFALHMIEISLFITLIWIVARSRNFNVSTRYALWLLALAKIFVPPFFAFPAMLPASLPAVVGLPSAIAEPLALAPAGTDFDPRLWLFGLWIGAAVLIAGVFIRRHWQLCRRLTKARPIVTSAFPICPAFETGAVTSPLLIGILRAKLYLPLDWRTWPQRQLHTILQHEAAHARSRDLWILCLETAALILFGLNPLVWLVRRRLAYLRELRCDLAAIAASGMSALDYGKLLCAFAERQAFPTAVSAHGFAFAAQPSSLFKRLQHILNQQESEMKTSLFGRVLLFGAMGVTMLVFSWQCSEPVQIDKTPSAAEKISESTAAQAFDVPPEIITTPSLKYPEAARQAGVEGVVFVQLLIDLDGGVAEVQKVSSRRSSEEGTAEGDPLHGIVEVDSLGYGLEQAALAAARTMKFKPAQQGGKPARATVSMPFDFKLQRENAKGEK